MTNHHNEQSEVKLEPCCPLCQKPLTVLPNGFAYCRNVAQQPISFEDWEAKSCLMSQHSTQLPLVTWQALNSRAPVVAPQGDARLVDREAAARVAFDAVMATPVDGESCRHCNGAGKVLFMPTLMVECKYCNGTGIRPATTPPAVTEAGEQSDTDISAFTKHLMQRHEELATAMRETCTKALDLIGQYTRPDFYMWLLHDRAGQKSDPYKRASEAKELLQNLLNGTPRDRADAPSPHFGKEERLCACGHDRSSHDFYEDHDECSECPHSGPPESCSEFRPVAASPSTSEAIRGAAEEIVGPFIRGSKFRHEDRIQNTITILSRWFGKGETEQENKNA